MRTTRMLLAGTILLSGSRSLAFADDVAPEPYRKWGQAIFEERCASCHGTAGRGDGPAAAALKSRPADLTEIANKNEGRFPRAKVSAWIDGETSIPAHGSREMPVWGRVLREEIGGPYGKAAARAEIQALTDYLESIQSR